MQRMKDNYERRSRSYLLRRTPVVIRIDGKAFHTYTRGMKKPFDEGLIADMQLTTRYLCENIQGAVLGYTQSDEISILLLDYKTLKSEAWFNYEIQKMCSVAASLATSRFNQLRITRHFHKMDSSFATLSDMTEAISTLPMGNFDARAFNLPKEEVANYFMARQNDAVKNSISMLAQSLYSHKQLQNLNGSQLQELTFQKGQNWNDLHFSKKRGSTYTRRKVIRINPKDRSQDAYRNIWTIDEAQFKFDDNYFKNLIYFDNEGDRS